MKIDYTLDEHRLVIDLIRRDNVEKPLTVGQVTFGIPNVIPVSNISDRNTLLIGTSIPGRGYTGQQSFYYNRVQLPAFVDPQAGDFLVFYPTKEVMLSDLLPGINDRFKTNITKAVIVDRPLPKVTLGSASIELTIAFNSLAYLGTVVLEIRPAA